MALPSTFAAVTVAPATATLAEFLTRPTMVPDAEITVAAESAASAAGSTIPAISAHDKHPARRLRLFIGAIPCDS